MEEEVIEEEVSLLEDNDKPEQIQAVEVETDEEEAPAFDVPKKFEGKSLEDVIESYVNLEKEYGNKSNEVGELRKWADSLLQAQTQPQAQPAEDINKVGFDDFVEDADKAVDKVLSTNPRLKKIEESIQEQAIEKSRRELLARHKDADEVVRSPEFQDWLQESPGRAKLLSQAHTSLDVDVASDMLDMYKTNRAHAVEEAKLERDAKAKGDLKKASVEKGGSPSKTKKIYKRSELIDLKINFPERYSALADEIKAAYAEGRVR